MSKSDAGLPSASNKDRRNFLRGASAAAVGVAAAAAMPLTSDAFAASGGGLTQGDIAILQFLCAAEQLETDLWQQYTLVAESNPAYAEALQYTLDDDVVIYARDTFFDEQSHDRFIAAFLRSNGVTPIDLTPFKTLPGPNVPGTQGKTFLTNLTSLSVDTSYYTRYHNGLNPDAGQQPPQLATIKNQSAVPTSTVQTAEELFGAAGVAGLHFASIEQGGSSLYNTLILQVSNVTVLRIVASIYATEAIHFAVFNKILENYPGYNDGVGSLVIPDLSKGKQNSQHVMATPTVFLDPKFPTCSVIRPDTTANSGAVAAATGLVNSGLFTGQSTAFLNATISLAKAADAAVRQPG